MQNKMEEQKGELSTKQTEQEQLNKQNSGDKLPLEDFKSKLIEMLNETLQQQSECNKGI